MIGGEDEVWGEIIELKDVQVALKVLDDLTLEQPPDGTLAMFKSSEIGGTRIDRVRTMSVKVLNKQKYG